MLPAIPHQQTAFPTTNIKLASILATLGFRFAQGMPCDICFIDQSNIVHKRWWFEQSIQWNGVEHRACLIENWYENKREFEAQHPDHPVSFMRAGLDARQWLVETIHGEHLIEEINLGGVNTFSTREIKFASVLVAARFKLVKYNDRNFTFLDDGSIAGKLAIFKTPFDAESPTVHTPIVWIRECLNNRDTCAALMRDPRLHAQILMNNRGRDFLVSSNASNETMRKLIGAT